MLDATQCAKITLCCANDYPGQICSIARSLEVVGERWSLLIVRDVMNGQPALRSSYRRPSAWRATCSPPACSGCSRRTSSSAEPYQRNPERYEYFLTEKGLDLWPALIALLNWGDRYSPSPDGPPMLIVHKECGGAVSDRGICEELRRGPPTPATPTP